MLHVLLISLLWLIEPPPERGPETPGYNLSDSADVSVSDVFQTLSHSSHNDCGAEVVPSLHYPTNPTDLGEAFCENTLLINNDGSVEPISIVCDHPAFERVVRAGFSEMRWQTHDIAGRPCPQLGTTIDYPIAFLFE